MTCGKSGWCLTDFHDTCPVEWYAWDSISRCTCDCHAKDAA